MGNGDSTRSVKHLNPRQGITTAVAITPSDSRCQYGVKHLNPRQGITTNLSFRGRTECGSRCRVKHLNPRQGITTRQPTG